MEEKGIVLPELSRWTAAELTPPDFTAPGRHPPEQLESFGGSSAPGVHRRSCPSAAARWLRQRPDCRRCFGCPAAPLPEYNPFRLHVAVRGHQRVQGGVQRYP